MELMDGSSLLASVEKAIPQEHDCRAFYDFLRNATYYCLNFMVNMEKIANVKSIPDKGIETLRALALDSFESAVIEWMVAYPGVAPEVFEEPDDWIYEQITDRFDEYVANLLTNVMSQNDCWLVCKAMDLLMQYEKEPEKPQLRLV